MMHELTDLAGSYGHHKHRSMLDGNSKTICEGMTHDEEATAPALECHNMP